MAVSDGEVRGGLRDGGGGARPVQAAFIDMQPAVADVFATFIDMQKSYAETCRLRSRTQKLAFKLRSRARNVPLFDFGDFRML